MSSRRPDRRVRSRPGVRRAVALVVVLTMVVVAVAGFALITTENDLRKVQNRQEFKPVTPGAKDTPGGFPSFTLK